MENKLVMRLETLDGEINYLDLGTIGEETPIKDKNNVQLKVGDIVLVRNSAFIYFKPVVKDKNGEYSVLDENSKRIASIQKAIGYENIKLGSIFVMDLVPLVKGYSIRYGYFPLEKDEITEGKVYHALKAALDIE